MKEFGRTILMFVVFTVLTGFIYPFVMTGTAKWFFPHKAEGSLIFRDGHVVGSSLVGQRFTGPKYFHGRPSANDYDASNSGGFNLGPDSRKLITSVGERAELIRHKNGLPTTAPIPATLVLASASGLDPHISPEGALLQARRISQARHLTEDEVKQVIESMTVGRGFFGPERVNVLEVNLALDSLKGRSGTK
jgi:potassium-transporting ATPase KdpC subunit